MSLFKSLNLIGGVGQPLSYPGRGAVLLAAGQMAGGLLQKLANDAGSTVEFTGAASVLFERP